MSTASLRSPRSLWHRCLPISSLVAVLAVTVAATGCAAGDPPALTPLTTQSSSEVSKELRTPEPKPKSPEQLIHEEAVALVNSASLRKNVASTIMSTLPTTDPETLKSFTTAHELGGVILMSNNIPSSVSDLAALTTAVQTDAEVPLLIAIDQEGGEVTRLPWDTFAGANSLKHEPIASTTDAFRGRANLLREAGINVNFGIVADFTPDQSSFIYGRSLGTSPEESSERVAAAVSAESGSVASTLKHFPGHGAAPGDSHFQIPMTDRSFDSWRSAEALPFEAGLEAGAELLMFGHLTYASVDPEPASLSEEWHRLARVELGFEGVSVTDDLGMLVSSGLPEYQDQTHNAIQSLQAGNDLVLLIALMDQQQLTTVIDGIVAAVEQGELAEERVIEAATRVMTLRLSLSG